MRFSAMLTLLAMAAAVGTSRGDEAEVKFPADVRGKAGRFITIEVTTTGKLVRWFPKSEDCDVAPTNERGTRALFTASSPGRYTIVAYSADPMGYPTPPAELVVTVTDKDGNLPDDRKPRPRPDDVKPTPPTPPAPNPEPPTPADPLAAELLTHYKANTDPDKATHVRQLAAVYRQAAALADSKQIKTASQLFGAIAAASEQLLPKAAIPQIRDRLNAELDRSLPTTPDAPLDDALRRSTHVLFDRIAANLEGLLRVTR